MEHFDFGSRMDTPAFGRVVVERTTHRSGRVVMFLVFLLITVGAVFAADF